MPSNRTETRFARRELGGPIYHSPLGKRLISRHFSAAQVARTTGVRKSAVSDFLHGRIKKAGKENCRLIRAVLIEMGVLTPRPRKPTVCRYCGIIYPTRKGAPLEFRPKPPDTPTKLENIDPSKTPGGRK